MNSIYLASPWVCRDRTRAVRSDLVERGYTVTSRWLDVPDGPAVPDAARGRAEAAKDLADIDAAEAIIVLTDDRPIGAGHHVEFGYALARGKRMIVVGPVKSVFHYLADDSFEDWPTAIDALGLPSAQSGGGE